MVKWTPKSGDDLDNLRAHIASNFNVELAIKISEELMDYTEELLSSNPLVGKIFEQNPLFSFIVYKGNTIYYCENPKDKDTYIVSVQCRGMKKQIDRLAFEI